MPLTNAELWIIQCKYYKSYIKVISNDSLPEAIFNWDEMIKGYR